jgi:hypothetical protein
MGGEAQAIRRCCNEVAIASGETSCFKCSKDFRFSIIREP